MCFSFSVHPVGNQFAQMTDAFSAARIYSACETTTPGAWTSDDVSTPGIVGHAITAAKRQKCQPPAGAEPETPSKCSKWISDVNELDVVASDDDEDEAPDVKPSTGAAAAATTTTSAEMSKRPKRQRKRKRKKPVAPEHQQQTVSAPALVKREESTTKPQQQVLFRVESVKNHIR